MVINPYLSGPLSVSHHQRTSCKESLIQLTHEKKGGFSGLCGTEHGYLQEGLTIHPLGWTVCPYRTLFFSFFFFFHFVVIWSVLFSEGNFVSIFSKCLYHFYIPWLIRCVYMIFFFHPYTGIMIWQESRGSECRLFHVHMMRAFSIENLKEIIKATCLQ